MADGGAGASAMGAREPARLPRDAQLIISLLHQMGIQDWEPRVINQLLEYTFRELPCSQFSSLAVPCNWNYWRLACAACLSPCRAMFRRLCERGWPRRRDVQTARREAAS